MPLSCFDCWHHCHSNRDTAKLPQPAAILFLAAVGSLLSSHCASYDSAAMPMPWHSWNHSCIALPVTILQLIVAFFAVAVALTTFYFLLPRPTSLTACCLHYCWQIADLKLCKNVASCQLVVDLLTICFSPAHSSMSLSSTLHHSSNGVCLPHVAPAFWCLCIAVAITQVDCCYKPFSLCCCSCYHHCCMVY